MIQINQKWHQQFFLWFCLTAIAAIFSQSSWVQWLDRKILDRQFQLARYLAPPQDTDPVVLIGIDEQTYQTFPEPFALWHQHLADLFVALAQAKISVLGIDIALPERSFNHVIAGIDQQLLRGILQLKRSAPLVLGITVDQSGQLKKIYPPFLSVAGKEGKGVVLWKKDIDHIVRQYQDSFFSGTQQIYALVGQMARHLGKTVPAHGWINYARGTKISYIPMQQVIQWYQQKNIRQLQRYFYHKAVILGTVLPFEDRHLQPLNLLQWEQNNHNLVPGVTIHVQALRNMVTGQLIQDTPAPLFWLLLLILALLFWLRLSLTFSISLALVLSLVLLTLQYQLLRHNLYMPISALIILLLLSLATPHILDFYAKIQERQTLRKAFAGYVSPNVMQEILSGELKPGIHGERHYISVLFSDIRSFTTISEKLTPEQVIRFLNIYLAAMSDAIQTHQGTVDKFIGDGIMAFFGAPKKLDNPAVFAFAAAKQKLLNLQQVNEQIREWNMPQLRIGIGLHIGDAVVGNIGSEQRNEYTAIGDVVNTASRLEGLTKQAGYPIVASADFVAALPNKDEFDNLGKMSVKGRADVAVFGWPPKQQDMNDRGFSEKLSHPGGSPCEGGE